MSICQPMISVTLPPLMLTENYAIQPRIFNLSINVIGLTMLGYVIARLIDGYHKALQGVYQEYTPELAAVLRANQSSNQTNNQTNNRKLHFPLVFPIYFKYLCVVFILFLCQSIISLFQPNDPINQPVIFYLSISMFAIFHAIEHGLLVFLCQRSIGENAIKRSIGIGCFWGVLILVGCVVGAGVDVANTPSPPSNLPIHGNSTHSHHFKIHQHQSHQFISELLMGHQRHHHSDHSNDPSINQHSDRPKHHPSLGSDMSGRTDWRVNHWFDLSGSSLIIDSESIDLFYILIVCLSADCLMLIVYAFLFLLRLKCLINLSTNQTINQLFMPWLRSRFSAFYLARFFFARRLLSFISMSLYFFNKSLNHSSNQSINESIDCLNVFVQLFQIGYGVCLYLFLVWDSRFWRRLEYLTNGPFPHYRSLDDRSNQSDNQIASQDTDPATSNKDDPNNRSIAPLLKLPKSGLMNLDSLIDCLIDFSELNIDTSYPLGLNQLHPSIYQSNNQTVKQSSAVYAATYRNQSVAVKRIKCDTLSINQIEDQLNEARFMKSINHSNIVRLIGICIRPPSICLVSELCENGTLFEWIKQQALNQATDQIQQSNYRSISQSSNQSNYQTIPISNYQSPLTNTEHARYHAFDQPNDSPTNQSNNQSINQMYSYCLDAVSAVAYLHNLSICHRDIKSTNFVIDQSDRCKLIDFGESFKQTIKSKKSRNSSLFPSTNQTIKRGTLGWMAPELLMDCSIPTHLTDCLGKVRIREIQFAFTHAIKQSSNQSNPLINPGGDQTMKPLTLAELHKILISVGIHDGGDVELINQSTNESDNQSNEDEWNDMLQLTYIRVQSMVAEQLNAKNQPSNQYEQQSFQPGTPSSNQSSSHLYNQSNNLPVRIPVQSTRSLSSISSLSFQSFTRTFFPRSNNQSNNQSTGQSNNPSNNRVISEKVDLYGLGMLIYSIHQTKLYPFSRIPSFLLPFLISAGVRPSIDQSINPSINLPPLLIRLIRSCWSPCPHHRPSANQLIDRLECIRFQLTGHISERLKMQAGCGQQSYNESNDLNNSLDPRPSTPSSVQVREGLYGQFYQRPRSITQSIKQSSTQTLAQSANSLAAYSLPPRLPSVPNSLNSSARFTFNQANNQLLPAHLSFSPSSNNQLSNPPINPLTSGHISAPSTPPSLSSSIVSRARSVSPERWSQSSNQPIYRSTHQSTQISQLINQSMNSDSVMGRIDSGSETDEEALETID